MSSTDDVQSAVPEAGSLPYTDDYNVGGPEFADVIVALNAVHDSLRMAIAPSSDAVEATRFLQGAAKVFSKYQVAEGEQAVSRRPDLPGRGNPLAAPFAVVEAGGQDDSWAAEGVFTAAYIGRGAVHGGWVTHIFDEHMGRLAEYPGFPARTAYLNVNFRSLTPIGALLRLEYRVVKRERRKIFVAGRLLHGEIVTADAEGLWVMPRAADRINGGATFSR